MDKPPRRIVSIVPSQSEFLWDIGLDKELAGITKFCIHPKKMFQSVERVGGTKNLDLEKIRKLKPDLIIGNKEENEISDIQALQKEFPVWMSDIYSFDDAFKMMNELGELCDRRTESGNMVKKIKTSIENIRGLFSGQTVAYFIWNQPYMFAARNTFIDHVLNHVGLKNALADYERYPELGVNQLKNLYPEFCFLSSEPFPFKEKHVTELQKVLPDSKILIVDGEMFSWYGSRLLHLEEYFVALKKSIG